MPVDSSLVLNDALSMEAFGNSYPEPEHVSLHVSSEAQRCKRTPSMQLGASIYQLILGTGVPAI